MRAVICHKFGSINDLVLEQVKPPEMKDDEVRIKVRAAGVSFATGLVVAGKYQRKLPLPFTPSTEVAGEVIEEAKQAQQFQIGDRVFAILDWGGWPEKAVAKSYLTHSIPAGLEFAQATQLPISYPTAMLHQFGKEGFVEENGC